MLHLLILSRPNQERAFGMRSERRQEQLFAFFFLLFLAFRASILSAQEMSNLSILTHSLHHETHLIDHWAEPVEIFDLRNSVGYSTLRDRYPELRPVADFAANGRFFVHASSFTNGGMAFVVDLVEKLPESSKLYIVGARQTYFDVVNEQLDPFLHLRPENSVFFIEFEAHTPMTGESKGRWLRDLAGTPVQFRGRRGEWSNGFVSSNYLLNFPENQRLFRLFSHQVDHINANFEWGNFMVIGRTGIVIDGPRLPQAIQAIDFAATGVDELIILPQPRIGDERLGIPHTDEFITILPDLDGNEVILTSIKEYQQFFSGRGYRTRLMPNNHDLRLSAGKQAGWIPDWINYVNVVPVVEGPIRRIFTVETASVDPRAAGIDSEMIEKFRQRDQVARAIYEELGYEVIASPTGTFNLSSFGGPHCFTSRLPRAQAGDPFVPGFLQKIKTLK